MSKKIIVFLSICFVVFGLLWLISTKSLLLDRLERGLANFYYFIREPGRNSPNPYVSSRSVLVGCDDVSLATVGKWPWKRNIHGEFLDNLQAYSPQTVMFDILFINEEKIPVFVSNDVKDMSDVRRHLVRSFKKMDSALAQSLSRYDNVYIDLQLVEKERHLSPAYRQRIRHSESMLPSYSVPADILTNHSPIIFNSLEPLIESYIRSAHPSVINVQSGEDGFIRNFPLYFTYRYLDGNIQNVFTVVSLMLQEYYRVSKDDIIIQRDKVIIRSAKVPQLDADKRENIRYGNLKKITSKLVNPRPPKQYPYNNNLYHLLVSDVRHSIKRGNENVYSNYPLHLLRKGNQYTILDTWERWDACRQAQCEDIPLILYEEKDIVIKTDPGLYNTFPINYAGRETIPYSSPGKGIDRYHPIPTYSYRDVFLDKQVPDLPSIRDLSSLSDKKIAEINEWFYQHCKQKAREIQNDMNNLGVKIDDAASFMLYISDNPSKTKYYLYAQFLNSLAKQGVPPARMHPFYKNYGDFIKRMGIFHEETHHLNSPAVFETLKGHYREQFDRFYNKFVFSGINSEGIGDVRQTPYGSMFGINVIINSFNTIITENQWSSLNDLPYFNLALLLFICLFCSALYIFFSVRMSAFSFIFLSLGLFILPIVLFYYNIRLEILPSLLGNTVIFVSSIVFKILTEGRDKRFLKNTFSAYLSPEVIEDMYRSKQRPKLGGEEGYLSAYFTDIEKFSTFSEQLSPHDLVVLLNEYLSAMTDILLKEQGTLDKYEGDAIIAFIGAPKTLADNPFRACLIALKMQDKLRELKEKWREEVIFKTTEYYQGKSTSIQSRVEKKKWPEIVWNMRMRIGINTGNIVVGNMGSKTRMNYTMMGDAVNLAARLESAAKQYGVYILFLK